MFSSLQGLETNVRAHSHVKPNHKSTSILAIISLIHEKGMKYIIINMNTYLK